jgi:hypothetical protein
LGAREVAKTMYIHVSKRKNDKIKFKRIKNLSENVRGKENVNIYMLHVCMEISHQTSLICATNTC